MYGMRTKSSWILKLLVLLCFQLFLFVSSVHNKNNTTHSQSDLDLDVYFSKHNHTHDRDFTPSSVSIQFHVTLADSVKGSKIVLVNCSTLISTEKCAYDFFTLHTISHDGFQKRFLSELNRRFYLLQQDLNASITIAISNPPEWSILQKTLRIYFSRTEVYETIICVENEDIAKAALSSHLVEEFNDRIRFVVNNIGQGSGDYHNKLKILALVKTNWVSQHNILRYDDFFYIF